MGVRAKEDLSLPPVASWPLPQLCFLWAAAIRRILARKGACYCYFGDSFFLFCFVFLRQDAFSPAGTSVLAPAESGLQ